MRYFWIFIFNLLGAYILILFLTGKGGVLENIKKAELITQLKENKIQLQTEVEKLKNKILLLRKLSEDENQVLLEQGRKKEDTLIFRFIESEKTENKVNRQGIFNDLFFKLYFSIVIVIILIITGNIIILLNYTRRGT